MSKRSIAPAETVGTAKKQTSTAATVPRVAKRRRPAKERADEQVGGAGLLKREQQDVVGMQAQGDARKDAGQRKAHW